MKTSTNDARAVGRHRRAACHSVSTLAVIAIAAALGGCVLTGREVAAERERLARAHDPAAWQALPLPASGDDWRGLVGRALVANADVRAAWYEWTAAVDRAEGAGAWPNTNAVLGASVESPGKGRAAINRVSFGAGFDGMENLSFPAKTTRAGKVAIEEANAAAERFRAVGLMLRRRVLEEWLTLAGAVATAEIAEEQANLARFAAHAERAASAAGSMQGPALAAETALAGAEDFVLATRAEIEAQRSVLAGLAAYDRREDLALPTRVPEPRRLRPAEEWAVALVAANPELAGLQAEVRAREQQVRLAKLAWIPDVNPSLAVTGGVAQMVGATLVLPTTVREIRAAIAEARSLAAAATAAHEQRGRDRRAELVAALVAARDAERSRRLYDERILPAARALEASVRSAYGAAAAGAGAWVDAESARLDAERERIDAAIRREKLVALVEELAGVDLEQPGNEQMASADPEARRPR